MVDMLAYDSKLNGSPGRLEASKRLCATQRMGSEDKFTAISGKHSPKPQLRDWCLSQPYGNWWFLAIEELKLLRHKRRWVESNLAKKWGTKALNIDERVSSQKCWGKKGTYGFNFKNMPAAYMDWIWCVHFCEHSWCTCQAGKFLEFLIRSTCEMKPTLRTIRWLKHLIP